MSKILIKSQPMAKIVKFSSRMRSFRQYSQKHWRRLTLFIVILLVVFFIYKSFTSEPKGMTTARVYRMALVSDFSANGKVKAKKQVDLKFYSPGKVSWLGVKTGDTVRAWQGIAALDTIPLNAAYQQALNNWRNYQANAEKVLDDVKDHSGDETFTQKATRTTAEVNRDNAYDAVLAARDNLKNAALITPISGIVVDTNELVSGLNLTGADLESKFIRIVNLESLYFEAQVDEVDYSKLKVGQEVSVTTDAYPGQKCSGKVGFIGKDGQVTTGGVVTIPVEITFNNCDLDFATGLNGQAHFVLTKIENVLVIPKKYIVTKNGVDYVWKMSGDTVKNRKLVPVKVGTATSTEAEILEGLSEGDQIVFVPEK